MIPISDNLRRYAQLAEEVEKARDESDSQLSGITAITTIGACKNNVVSSQKEFPKYYQALFRVLIDKLDSKEQFHRYADRYELERIRYEGKLALRELNRSST